MTPDALLLVATVAGVGVLHTVVPDHWAPIALLARQRGWSRAETARVAFKAGVGHVVSTLAIGLVVWCAGLAFATRFGAGVDTLASVALILFGGWIAVSALREMHAEDGGHGHAHGHSHAHHHGHGDHAHHDHGHHDHAHPGGRDGAAPDAGRSRTALILVMGSSPMVEGIPAFFAAESQGPWVIALMAAVFALGTISTYVLLCVCSAAGLRRLRLGHVERYGEVLSGAAVALVGAATLAWPLF